MPFAHNVYRLFFSFFFYCVIDLFIVYSMCNSVLLSVHTAMLYPGQVTVVNDNLFSTSLPGLNKGEIKKLKINGDIGIHSTQSSICNILYMTIYTLWHVFSSV